MSLKDYVNLIIERRAAQVAAEEANEKRMKMVHEIDNEWLSEHRNAPAALTREQQEIIDKFWNKYSFAYKNDSNVQAHFSTISGKFSPYYVNYGLNAYYMYRYYDDPVYHTAFHNKNYRELLFKEFKSTPVLVRRISGIYYDANHNIMSYNAAIESIENHISNSGQHLIVKPTPGGGGNGIVFLNKGLKIEEISIILDEFKKDDILIEKIQNSHPSYSIANPTSLNTLRIVTYLNNNTVNIIATIFRMGGSGNNVDNFSSGGIACGVHEDGTCFDYAYDKNGKIYKAHPNGFEFSGHLLYNVENARSMAKKMHYRIPQFKQISWDIAIDEEGKTILVEMNPRGGANLYQSTGALPYGDDTPQVIDDMLFTYFFKNGANKEWNYREYTDHIVLAEYCWNAKDIIVPEQINGKYVTQISDDCFKNENIESITIPGCVKEFSDKICNNSNVKIVKLDDERNIVVPSPVSAKGALSLGANTVQWEVVDGVTHYLIYRMKNNGEMKFIKKVSSLCNNFVDTNVIDGETYHYYIYGFDSQYAMKSENHASVALKAWCKLSTPENLDAVNNNGSVELSWDKVTGATHYLVYRMELGKKRVLLKSVAGESLTFSDSKYNKHTVYYYYVRALNANSNIVSDFTNYKMIRPKV